MKPDKKYSFIMSVFSSHHIQYIIKCVRLCQNLSQNLSHIQDRFLCGKKVLICNKILKFVVIAGFISDRFISADIHLQYQKGQLDQRTIDA